MGEEYLLGKLLSYEREGFLWNKLNRPRSYDYKKNEKPHKDRLRMPKFTFAQDQKKQAETIEAVMTFVLGLVADPPPTQYVTPPTRAKRKSSRAASCLRSITAAAVTRSAWSGSTSCSNPERANSTSQRRTTSSSRSWNRQRRQSKLPPRTKTDKSGRQRATLWGMFSRNKDTGEIAVLDEDGSPVEDPAEAPPGTKFTYQFNNYEPLVVDGKPVPVTPRSFIFPDSLLAKKGPGEKTVRYWPAVGGDLTKLLFPVVLRDAVTKPGNPNEAYGWLPPPLFNEGRKVQTKWLHDFLLDPKPIRPAAVLRMPKFNMSSAEAQAFAEYFAAMDNAAYPYEVNRSKATAI